MTEEKEVVLRIKTQEDVDSVSLALIRSGYRVYVESAWDGVSLLIHIEQKPTNEKAGE